MTQDDSSPEKQQRVEDFERGASQSQPGIFTELLEFLTENRKWWLTPIIVVLLLVGVLVILGSTGAAPFIYTLF